MFHFYIFELNHFPPPPRDDDDDDEEDSMEEESPVKANVVRDF